ncbi:hypothetical protein J5N97_012183 [Dioscorea zingiberensis]|uniref:Glycine-rich protein n=1 Tax=Dioscorea zingiberensis TaxID=325984 RepID=A0A9D5CP97_9LILI|nr:hypothetical protein J5N97_012183 [Dioscorea zingiberensis]
MFVLLLLVVFLSCCTSGISLEEGRKINAVGKLSGGRGGGGGRSVGGGGGRAVGGGSSGSSSNMPRTSGSSYRTPSGTMIPAVVAGSAGARGGATERKHNAAALGHLQPLSNSLVAAMLGVAILLFV